MELATQKGGQNNMKKLISLLVAICVLSSGAAMANEAEIAAESEVVAEVAAEEVAEAGILETAIEYKVEQEVTVKVDGITLEIADQKPVIENDRTLVPLRAIFEALDATVEWIGETGTVIATKGENTVELTIGSTTYKVNDQAKEMDVPAQIKNSRTLVPLSVVSESLGCSAEWDGEAYEVNFCTPAHQAVVAETDRIRAIKPTVDGAYKTVGEGVRLPIKMYIPEEDTQEKKIAVLTIHGGSWYAITEDSDSWDGSWMNYQAQYYYDKFGYTTAAISYRGINFDGETTVFDIVEDCKDAVAYMREQADFDKLIIMGDSSGGHLAVELGLDDEVDADIIVAANPVLDLTVSYWGYAVKTEEDRAVASPSHNTKKTDTKFLVMHGNKDVVVDYQISKKFCDDMTALGTQCDFIELDGKDHAFLLSRYQSTDEMINEFMGMIDAYLADNL